MHCKIIWQYECCSPKKNDVIKIFMSYASEDRARVQPYYARFETHKAQTGRKKMLFMSTIWTVRPECLILYTRASEGKWEDGCGPRLRVIPWADDGSKGAYLGQFGPSAKWFLLLIRLLGCFIRQIYEFSPSGCSSGCFLAGGGVFVLCWCGAEGGQT